MLKHDQLQMEALAGFDCGNDDLNEFFRDDAKVFEEGLMGKTYAFVLENNPLEIVCTFAVSNDSIKVSLLANSRKKKVEKEVRRSKQMRTYPAVMVGRLGVSGKFAGQGIGRQLLDFIKYWFSEAANKTGCRFVVVDAYKTEQALAFYLKNGFEYVFSTEEQEAEYNNYEGELKTRLMFFDLIKLRTS